VEILDRAVDLARGSLIASATGPFAHGSYPLADSLRYEGDPGLFGPGSVSWRVVGDVAAFVGGVRALFVQSAHPEVVAGVEQHSRYREDPLGRLARTSAYVTATTFGAMPEVEAAVAKVRRAHRIVAGYSHRGLPYSADAPALSAWVHNALTDSFLRCYQEFGPERLTDEEADRFVAEQSEVGKLLDADPLPSTAAGLAEWVEWHPHLGPSPGMEDAIEFLRRPPLETLGQKAGYQIMQAAAVATLPERLRRVLDVKQRSGALPAGRALMATLRWALGMSPSWNLALVRVGAQVPSGLFRQPLPPPGAGATGRAV
jgi:uncharacterized protein (DUF2236 family)